MRAYWALCAAGAVAAGLFVLLSAGHMPKWAEIAGTPLAAIAVMLAVLALRPRGR